MKRDSLGDRMKGNYEDRNRTYLTRRTPVIIRLDGKAFHTLTKHCVKPYDQDLQDAMQYTAMHVFKNIQGAKLAYVQSDEISILVTDYDTLESDAWFDYNVQKMVSVSASYATAYFNTYWTGRVHPIAATVLNGNPAVFDSRVFNVPREEVGNYFYWRFIDWVRNSISMLAQANFSHKELLGKSQVDMHEMLHTKGLNWANESLRNKNGVFIYRNPDEPLNIRYFKKCQVITVRTANAIFSQGAIIEDPTVNLKEDKDFIQKFI